MTRYLGNHSSPFEKLEIFLSSDFQDQRNLVFVPMTSCSLMQAQSEFENQIKGSLKRTPKSYSGPLSVFNNQHAGSFDHPDTSYKGPLSVFNNQRAGSFQHRGASYTDPLTIHSGQTVGSFDRKRVAAPRPVCPPQVRNRRLPPAAHGSMHPSIQRSQTSNTSPYSLQPGIRTSPAGPRPRRRIRVPRAGRAS
jgi:hypothetical protein